MMRLAATKDAHRKSGFSLGLENLAEWEGIFQSGNLEQIGKVREIAQNTGKGLGISDKC